MVRVFISLSRNLAKDTEEDHKQSVRRIEPRDPEYESGVRIAWPRL